VRRRRSVGGPGFRTYIVRVGLRLRRRGPSLHCRYTRSRRIWYSSRPFVLPEHVQNMPFIGGAPDSAAVSISA